MPKRVKNRPKRFVNEISVGKPFKKRKRKFQIKICIILKQKKSTLLLISKAIMKDLTSGDHPKHPISI
jgi:hypothetical protein